MADSFDTQKFVNPEKAQKSEIRAIIQAVYDALKEKGYSPINQIVGYILSGDPTYITGHMGARGLITKYERDEVLEEFVRYYLDHNI